MKKLIIILAILAIGWGIARALTISSGSLSISSGNLTVLVTEAVIDWDSSGDDVLWDASGDKVLWE